jgi:hypothetical protein
MKRIINGKVYDTDTSKYISRYSVNTADSFDYFSEALYRKKTGEFFLLGEGGARTVYAVHTEGYNWRGGSKIIPLSPGAARDWAEEHLSPDKYAEIFEPITDSDDSVTVSARIPASLAARISAAAAADGLSASAYIAGIIRDRFGNDD